MIEFSVNDMTCSHCVAAVTRAVKSVEPGATVSVNLDDKRVQIGASRAGSGAFRAAIEEAGYTPVETASGTPAVARAGGCCGSCH